MKDARRLGGAALAEETYDIETEQPSIIRVLFNHRGHFLLRFGRIPALALRSVVDGLSLGGGTEWANFTRGVRLGIV